MAIGTIDLGRNVQSFSEGDALLPVTQVIINYGTSENGLTLSKEAHVTPNNGRVVEKTVETITDGDTVQSIANNLLAQYRENEQHESVTITGAELTPLVELGDGMDVNNKYTEIGSLDVNFTKAMYSDVESQGITEEDDFPYLSSLTDKATRDLNTVKTAITVQTGRITQEITARQAADTTLTNAVNERVQYTELSTKIDNYIDTTSGTAKIVSACSGTYLTQTGAANTYTTISRTATLEQSVTADEAKIALVVSSSGGSNSVNSASIVTAINNSGSSVIINASKINLSGYLTITAGDSRYDASGSATSAVSGLESELASGSTTINGGCITTGTVLASRVGAGTFDMGSGYGYVGRGSGNNGVSSTTGVVLSSYSSGSTGLGTGDYYFIATNSGARMTGGNSYVYCTDDYVTLCGQNGYDIYVQSSAIVPSRNNSVQLGYSNYAWTVGYSYSWAEVSDRDKKENIDYDVSAYEALFDKLKPCKFNYISEDETKLVKTGFIAQDIEQAMTEIGMPMKDFDGLRFDYDEATGTKSNYSLCYNDIICLVVKEVQKLKAKVAQLEANLN